MTDFGAVLFDWRGTLVTTLGYEDWVRTALRQLGRDDHTVVVRRIMAAIVGAAGEPNRLDPPGLDCDAVFHRDTYHRVFADAGLDPALSEALYSVESDATHNPFAVDAVPVLRGIAEHGLPIGVVSDIHFDLRPAFAAAGIADVVSAFVLSYEHGVQKPDPAIFRRAADEIGVPPERTLMVGDRHGYDGGAVEVGMTTLLLPPLRDVRAERLHLAARLLGVPVGKSCAT
ncbi:HAD family hydrolase [Micromonospora palythoicola]|uniref:HAD family hydrolase n=1 Tax=Micromonospora palythoicola TaxID=3120507 RepID=UPI002FCE2F31